MRGNSLLHAVVIVAFGLLMTSAMADSPRGRCEGVTNDSPFANRVLCNDPQLSELDDMMLELHWQKYDRANKEEKAVLAEARQRWDIEVRIPCQDQICLIDVYEQRIKELGGTPPKRVNFRIAEPHTYDEICPVFLSVINRVEPEEILPCKAPEYDVRPFSVFDDFQPMNTSETKEFFEVVNQKRYKTPERMSKYWDLRLEEISAGYFRYANAELDIDDDGLNERIVRLSIPSRFCEIIPRGTDDMDVYSDFEEQEWDEKTLKEKARHTNEHGSVNHYYVFNKNTTDYLKSGSLMFLHNQWLILSTKDMRRINLNMPDLWSTKNWISIANIGRSKAGQLETAGLCGYWLNF